MIHAIVEILGVGLLCVVAYGILDVLGLRQMGKLVIVLTVIMAFQIIIPAVKTYSDKWNATAEKIDKLQKQKADIEKKYDNLINFGNPGNSQKDNSKIKDIKKKMDEIENAPWVNWGAPKEDNNANSNK